MVTNTSGKKKTAVARATVREGEGRVRINSKPVELVEPEMSRLKMLEPFRIAGEDLRSEMDIDIRVEGGGISGQADAVRTAIARGIVQYTNDAELRDAYMEFDRSLLVNDVRQSEPKKWGGPGARARYQKSYR
ncbi:ribosomal protein S9P [Haloterrigena turkmenica DSM 5511]|uniref:Small ribosomal subunit protein uS9 n=1 Tax=Haloterrigena turkmenica (strain ATCC 51198 / DSM 5511 / JCM 9101 / NCIMB 13204 / VKM B-1734 / 4k) TaxID=543526 RepID=D2RVZ6_HALTV|nr:30S ribosomal protein S9 [Haloterrigena turkmenica]ADB61425.1 ribosomal protein S9P [Haloterrigena turkmenica DSM 5511]